MLILHISDIHFRAPECNTPHLDPDRPYRTILIQDVRTRCGALGAADVILVGGDIAYGGLPAEYAAAHAWLTDLALASGCPMERVFVVPGNHDVDRRVIRETPSVRNAQQAIARATPARRERELSDQFRDAETGRALLAPLAAYNEFAAKFNCQLFPPERLYWRQDLKIDQRLTLRVNGLTSTLLSGAGSANGAEDTRLSLYLSPLQTVLDPVEDVVNLVLCHHPPDWFLDQDEIEDAIRARAGLQLFGHKHRQRIHRDPGYVRLSVGAVNPDRYEVGWQPGYNLIRLMPGGPGSGSLDMEIHSLAWQSDPAMFRPLLDTNGETVFRHQIPTRTCMRREPGAEAGVVTPASGSAPRVSGPAEIAAVEAPIVDEFARHIVLRFWGLPSSKRREIALRLGLIAPEDLALPEPERYGRALLEANRRGVLDQVAREIDAGGRS